MTEQGTSSLTAERVARNDATFREANERIRDVAAGTRAEQDGLLPFLCECADLGCTEILKLSASEYEAVREHPARFINAEGHLKNAQGWARRTGSTDRYVVVEKVGEAAAIAAELDPRKDAG